MKTTDEMEYFDNEGYRDGVKRYSGTDEIREALLGFGFKEASLNCIELIEKNLSSNEEFFCALQNTAFIDDLKNHTDKLLSIKEELQNFTEDVRYTVQTGAGIRNAQYAMHLTYKADDWIEAIEHTMPILNYFRELSESFINSTGDTPMEEFAANFISSERGISILNKLYENGCKKLEALRMTPGSLYEVKEKINISSITYVIR